MLTLSKSIEAIEKAKAKAAELGVAVTISVVDQAGTLIAVERMDGAIAVSPEISYAKAFTSATLGVPSAGIAEYAVPGKPYFGVTSLVGGKLTPIAGGQPIKMNGAVVGGIGVGGSMDVSQDDACATAGVAVFS